MIWQAPYRLAISGHQQAYRWLCTIRQGLLKYRRFSIKQISSRRSRWQMRSNPMGSQNHNFGERDFLILPTQNRLKYHSWKPRMSINSSLLIKYYLKLIKCGQNIIKLDKIAKSKENIGLVMEHSQRLPLPKGITPKIYPCLDVNWTESDLCGAHPITPIYIWFHL